MKKSSEFIKTHKDLLDERLFGGKFAKQAVLYSKGVNIPAFFCLSPKAYRSIFDKIDQAVQDVIHNIDWSSSAHIKEAESEIRQLFIKESESWDFKEKILSFFDDFFVSSDYVSVRSSMVAQNREFSEDSQEHSFAGMSESFLYVTREQLVDRVIDCFASGHSSQVLLYRHSLGVDDLNFCVSVGIQKMIFGKKSFVCFTCDPNTMAEDTLIVAGHGIGEGVVQEKIETDHYFVHSKTAEVTKKVVEKNTQVLLDRERGSGIQTFPVPKEYSNEPVLNDHEILKIDKVAKKIQEVFSYPQDIEGCFDSSGTLYILQSRPVQFSLDHQMVWSNANITESFPGTTTPLTFQFSRRFYEVIFRDCYLALGVPKSWLKQRDAMLKNMIGFHFGKIYYNLTCFYTLHSLSPLFPFFRKQWEEMMGFSSSFYVSESRRSFWDYIKKIGGAFYTFWGALIITWRFLTNQRDVDRFLRNWENHIKDFRGKKYEDESSFELLEVYAQLWTNVEKGWWITLLNDTHLPTAYKVTEFLMKRWLGDKDESLLSNLLCGAEELKSVEIIYSGLSLSESIKSDPALLKLFNAYEPTEILKEINNNPEYLGFKNKLETHLHMFGDRGLQELKLEQPNIRHRPSVLIQMVKNYLEKDMTVEEIKKEEMDRRYEGEKVLKNRLTGLSLKRMVLNFQLKLLRGFIRNRENMRYCRSEFFGVSKNIFMAIGRDFEEAGLIEKSKDIFFLTPSEIEELVRGCSPLFDIKQHISLRQKEYSHNEEVDLPMDFVTRGAVYKNTIPVQEYEDQSGDIKGLGSCPGVVEGRAKVVLDPNEVNSLADDEILIARETDPGWLFLMLAARGIVVERGSMLSHTAITGRKFGIPTIVSVPGVTKRLQDGQRIRIDGGKGIVEVME